MNNKNKWSDITLGEYLVIRQLQEEHKEDSAKYIIEYLYDIILDEEPMITTWQYIEKLRFLGEPINEVKLKDKYNINGNVYKLDVFPQNFTYSQFMDWQNYGAMNDDDTIVGLLSVVLIPDGHKYSDGYDMQRVKDDILNINMEDVNAITTFFFALSKSWLKVLNRFLSKMIKKSNLTKEQMEEVQTKVNKLMDYYRLR